MELGAKVNCGSSGHGPEPDPLLCEARQHPERDKVAEADRGVDLGMTARERDRDIASEATGGPATEYYWAQAILSHDVKVAGYPLDRDWSILEPTNENDVAAAELAEMPCSKSPADRIVRYGKWKEIGPVVDQA